ncbi:MAG: hypothetical protein ACTSVV_02600 [Promethearchaeota archaeon]
MDIITDNDNFLVIGIVDYTLLIIVGTILLNSSKLQLEETSIVTLWIFYYIIVIIALSLVATEGRYLSILSGITTIIFWLVSIFIDRYVINFFINSIIGLIGFILANISEDHF